MPNPLDPAALRAAERIIKEVLGVPSVDTLNEEKRAIAAALGFGHRRWLVDKTASIVAEETACAEMAAALEKYRRKLPAYMGVRIDPRVIGDCHGTADAALARYRKEEMGDD